MRLVEECRNVYIEAGLKRYWDALPVSFQKKLVGLVKPKFAIDVQTEFKNEPKAGELRRALLHILEWTDSNLEDLLTLPENHPATEVSSSLITQDIIRFLMPTLAGCRDLHRWLPSLTPARSS